MGCRHPEGPAGSEVGGEVTASVLAGGASGKEYGWFGVSVTGSCRSEVGVIIKGDCWSRKATRVHTCIAVHFHCLSLSSNLIYKKKLSWFII